MKILSVAGRPLEGGVRTSVNIDSLKQKYRPFIPIVKV